MTELNEKCPTCKQYGTHTTFDDCLVGLQAQAKRDKERIEELEDRLDSRDRRLKAYQDFVIQCLPEHPRPWAVQGENEIGIHIPEPVKVMEKFEEMEAQRSKDLEVVRGLVGALEPFEKRLKGWADMLIDGTITQPISEEWLEVQSTLLKAREHFGEGLK